MATERELRLKGVVKGARQDDPDTNMSRLLDVLKPSVIIPEVDKYYVFVYKAKTPGIQYDQHPLVLVGSIFSWGFNGYNEHWGRIRQYTWNEVLSNIYELSEAEYQTCTQVPLAKFRTT